MVGDGSQGLRHMRDPLATQQAEDDSIEGREHMGSLPDAGTHPILAEAAVAPTMQADLNAPMFARGGGAIPGTAAWPNRQVPQPDGIRPISPRRRGSRSGRAGSDAHGPSADPPALRRRRRVRRHQSDTACPIPQA